MKTILYCANCKRSVDTIMEVSTVDDSHSETFRVCRECMVFFKSQIPWLLVSGKN